MLGYTSFTTSLAFRLSLQFFKAVWTWVGTDCAAWAALALGWLFVAVATRQQVAVRVEVLAVNWDKLQEQATSWIGPTKLLGQATSWNSD